MKCDNKATYYYNQGKKQNDTHPEWLKPKEKPYFHQISLDCIEKLVECIERFNKGEIDADTSSKIEKQILVDEYEDEEFLEFAIEHFAKCLGTLNTGR